MQFVKNGPDIPERLLQAHEDGKVVFFCGAGISYPAGLPDFKNLVTEIYREMGAEPDKNQNKFIQSGQFDAAIGSLESNDVGGREDVREKLAEILKIECSNLNDNATATHRALLTLGKTREGKMRLITTNFDRIFECVICKEAKEKKQKKDRRYQAPLLPIPKNHWNGLVYLHGRLPFEQGGELDHLVISSGDFGLAYLTERWAARFVSELLRNYTVCFVGYSINDSILRYMMDAIAADRLRGEISPEMFAFGSYSKGKQKEQEKQWREKNVTPILYKKSNKHSYLHKTLRSWSETYRDGLGGKSQIVESLARTKPSASTEEDDFVGRMLWALSAPKGLPAKRFAEHNPVPSLDWLKPLSENYYRHNDLDRFGVPKKSVRDDKLEFSFVKRPTPYDKAPPMTLVNQVPPYYSKWDNVMWYLGRWLTRHLDDLDLILWTVKQGEYLHYKFKKLIQEKLQRLDYLEKSKEQKDLKELEQIRAGSPRAIPSSLMRMLWELNLAGRLKQATYYHDNRLGQWFNGFNLSGLTPSLRMEIREILTPHIDIDIQKPFIRGGRQSETDSPQHMRDLISGEIALATNNVHKVLKEQKDNIDWNSALPDLLGDFNLLLRDALDLMRALGEAEDISDRSYVNQPSISKHSQNSDFRNWTALIDLTRDAWLATAKKDIEQARLIAEGWWKTPYPLFKRLAFFAATERGDVISDQQALKWLLADNHWWLWSVGVRRETMRLLATLARRLDVTAMSQVEKAILKGPPRKMFIQDIEEKKLKNIVDDAIWLRLARLQGGGAKLSRKASSKLNVLTRENKRELLKNEQDDFPTWFEPVTDIMVEFLSTPQKKPELIKWLRQYHEEDIRKSDDWRDRCKQDFDITSGALIYFVNQGEWLEDRWRQAFSAWADDKILKKSWASISKVIIKAPDSLIKVIAVELSWWLREQAGKFEGQEELFFRLTGRILKLKHQGRVHFDGDPMLRAINHPVGIVIEALLKWWYRHPLKDGQGLPNEIKPLFTKICDTEHKDFRHGRTVLGTHVINLFRVDKEWTSTNLLSLFDWQQSKDEACSVWVGFLRAPRLYRPLMEVIKQPFFETAKHYEKLGMFSEQYTSFLMFVALDPGDTFKRKDLRNATYDLPQEIFPNIVNGLTRALNGIEEEQQRKDFWRNRIKPYFRSIWPRSLDFKSSEISESLAQLCVAAREVFPEAYKELKHWLKPLDGSWEADFIARNLREANLSEQFPKDVLEFLDAIISEERQSPNNNLSDCLNIIREKQPELESDKRFQRLSELIED